MPSDLPTRFTEIDLDDGLSRRVPSPGRCIYCGATGVDLTHEHALPLALAGHTLVIENSCCKVCQAIIQPYEQDVLKKQLGTFRAQVEAPTRRPKDRATTVTMPFEEVDDTGRGAIRDLGSRTIPIADAPLMLNLWASPPPRILLEPDATPPGTGQAWSFCEREVAHRLNRKIAEETGANHVRIKIGTVNRLNYLRFLAKTAHAYAVAELGLDGFDPLLLDLILKRSDDVGYLVGDDPLGGLDRGVKADTVQSALGSMTDGPLKDLIGVGVRFWPALDTPPHLVFVGTARGEVGTILDDRTP